MGSTTIAPKAKSTKTIAAKVNDSEIAFSFRKPLFSDSLLTRFDASKSDLMPAFALQSAVGGMALSIIGMVFAATGHLSPVSGAITQEVIDVLAVLNALRAAFPPKVIHDISEGTLKMAGEALAPA